MAVRRMIRRWRYFIDDVIIDFIVGVIDDVIIGYLPFVIAVCQVEGAVSGFCQDAPHIFPEDAQK